MMKMRAEDGYVAERYMDHGVPYVRVKYKNKERTEVIMQEVVFEKIHGKFENEDAENIKRAS